jgi:CheY-like chemotaxis protein
VNEKPDLKKKVLIAEDDPISRRLLEAFLTRWGYEVAVATSGTEALQALEKKDAPRLAVLDWMMPGLEAFKFANESANARTVPTSISSFCLRAPRKMTCSTVWNPAPTIT